jgi:2,4-dienoyl-CoA reductase (NADPH2)
VGGDLAAVELAEFLAENGRRVHLFEAGEQIAPEVGLKRRSEHMDRLDRLAVAVHTGVEVRCIDAGSVEIAPALSLEAGAGPTSQAFEARRRVAADQVILAGAIRPDTSLADTLRASLGDAVDVHTVGDCTGLGLIRKAIVEAAQVATAL